MRPVVVVGPHRSGTSVTTRIVSLLGPRLCTSEDRMVPDRTAAADGHDNPFGHWESRTLTSFNDELLGHLGGSWSAPPPPMAPEDLRSRLASYRNGALERFARVHPEPGWVWKDPRLCLLLPFWLDVLDADPVVVLTARPARRSAESLVRRNQLAPAHALALWHRYVSEALVHCAGLSVIVVHFDRLLDDPAGQVLALRKALGRLGAPMRDDPAAVEEAVGAVHPELRHHGEPEERHKTSGKEVGTALTRLVIDLGGSYEKFSRIEPPRMSPSEVELLETHRRLEQARRSRDESAALARQLRANLEAQPEDRLRYRLPTIPCDSRADFASVQGSELFAQRYKLEVLIARRHQDQSKFTLPGLCLPCGFPVDFQLDWQYAHPEIDAGWLSPDRPDLKLRIPNWREGLICPRCGMNNRQRAIAAGIRRAVHDQAARLGRRPRVYFNEQITPMYRFFSQHVPEADSVGSEYLGPEMRGGQTRDGIRHEDVESLSFGNAGFDLSVSCSVLEHVNQPMSAIRELTRILRPGGECFLEVPFDTSKDRSVRRSRRVRGEIEHILPAEYHGNPLSDEGSLVFFDFGWEFFDQLNALEDIRWRLVVYWNLELGHLGGAQFYFHGLRD